MPDPIDQLHDFAQLGTPVNPISATEVRRRGDRLRRRNRVLTGVGTLAAAVVLVGTPIAILSQHHGSHGIEPTHPVSDPQWLEAVPTGFDLAAGLNGQDQANPPRQSDRPGVSAITPCGISGWTLGVGDPAGPPLDVAGATYELPNSESSAARTLALYPDATTAARAYAAIRSAVADCPVDRSGGAPQVYDLHEADLVADESFVFTQQSELDVNLYGDLHVYEIARTGNALFVEVSGSGPGGDAASEAAIERLDEYSASVISDLRIFSRDSALRRASA